MAGSSYLGRLMVEPLGGLGSRMHAIVAGVSLNRLLNKKMSVIWDTGPGLNCPYDFLFKRNTYFDVIPKSKSGYRPLSSFNDNFLKRQLTKVANKVNGIDLAIVEQDLKKTFYQNDYDTLSLLDEGTVYIKTSEAFLYSNEWRILKPIHQLQDRISEISASFASHIIGIHIRRGDNTSSRAQSPFFLFYDAITNEIAENKGARFYLSTDDIQTQKQLLNDFGDKITVQQNKDFSRATITGVQDSLVDMYCLSKTSKLIGSYGSSFTEAAAAIQKTPLVILDKDNS